jgi:hypothetical protein
VAKLRREPKGLAITVRKAVGSHFREELPQEINGSHFWNREPSLLWLPVFNNLSKDPTMFGAQVS